MCCQELQHNCASKQPAAACKYAAKRTQTRRRETPTADPAADLYIFPTARPMRRLACTEPSESLAKANFPRQTPSARRWLREGTVVLVIAHLLFESQNARKNICDESIDFLFARRLLKCDVIGDSRFTGEKLSTFRTEPGVAPKLVDVLPTPSS